jgi:hypothetical protein
MVQFSVVAEMSAQSLAGLDATRILTCHFVDFAKHLHKAILISALQLEHVKYPVSIVPFPMHGPNAFSKGRYDIFEHYCATQNDTFTFIDFAPHNSQCFYRHIRRRIRNQIQLLHF